MTTLTADQIAELTKHNLEVWDRCAPTYADGFEALTGGATTALLDLAGVGRGTELLDVGTGPGTLIAAAQQRGARVSAIDLAPRMVERARARHPDTDIAVGDASSLPYPGASFDAVTIGFCLHHAADPGAVLGEVDRVLRPGGRIALSVWAAEDRLEAFGVAFAAVGESLPLDLVPNVQAPGLGFEPGDYEGVLSSSGFVHPTARTLELSWSLTDGAAIFDGFDRFLDLSGQPPSIREEIRQRLDQQIRQRAGADGVAHLANPAIIAAAGKP